MRVGTRCGQEGGVECCLNYDSDAPLVFSSLWCWKGWSVVVYELHCSIEDFVVVFYFDSGDHLVSELG